MYGYLSSDDFSKFWTFNNLYRAKIAVQCFKKRMASKEPKVIYLTLEVLDLAMQHCGNSLHILIGTKEFMNVLIVLLN